MIVPNKAISYEKSLLSKLPRILKLLTTQGVPASNLFQESRKDFDNVNQFLLAMDTLYILNKIDYVDGDIKLC
jgi:hypothetical protein